MEYQICKLVLAMIDSILLNRFNNKKPVGEHNYYYERLVEAQRAIKDLMVHF